MTIIQTLTSSTSRERVFHTNTLIHLYVSDICFQVTIKPTYIKVVSEVCKCAIVNFNRIFQHQTVWQNPFDNWDLYTKLIFYTKPSTVMKYLEGYDLVI